MKNHNASFSEFRNIKCNTTPEDEISQGRAGRARSETITDYSLTALKTIA